MAATAEPSIVAFFDVDNTLLRGASGFHLALGAYRRGIFTLRAIIGFAFKAASYAVVGEKKSHLDEARAQATPLLKGRTVAELRSLAEEVWEKYTKPRIWPETIALAREHQAKGHQVWLITATPDFIAQVIADKLQLDGALGTKLDQVDGEYTGDLSEDMLHGEAKAEAARELARSMGVDISDCWAYSDSVNDLPLLTTVGHRIVVNPDRKLRAYASELGWDSMKLDPAGVREERRRIRQAAAQERKKR